MTKLFWIVLRYMRKKIESKKRNVKIGNQATNIESLNVVIKTQR